jgi:hypothetical protein
MPSKTFCLIALGILAGFAQAGVPRSDCFPLERLDPAAQKTAEKLLWSLLDSEALYTVIGQLKPVSMSYWHGQVPADGKNGEVLESYRRCLQQFRCGDRIEADILLFHRVNGDKRSAAAFVADRPSVRRVMAEHPKAFAAIGATPEMKVREILERVDRAEAADRWRAFGLLFGYPPEAVEFFVQAGVEEKKTGVFVKRKFLHIPTYVSDKGRFVYAVAVDHKETDTDRRLRQEALRILEDYRRRRAIYADPKTGAGPAFLLRDWYDGGRRFCDPSHANWDPPVKR